MSAQTKSAQTKSAQTMPLNSGISIPAPKTIMNLAIGGVAGLLLWEVFARVVTKAVLGYPLEPAGLIDAILNHQLGFSINVWLREALHYGVGILGYPVAYFVISRHLPKWSTVLDAVVFITFTVAIAYSMQKNGVSPGLVGFWFAVVALIASRYIIRNESISNAITWGNFTWMNALCIMAPLGGLSFYLLGEGGDLSFMSFVGHVIYGSVAVLVFNKLEARAA